MSRKRPGRVLLAIALLLSVSAAAAGCGPGGKKPAVPEVPVRDAAGPEDPSGRSPAEDPDAGDQEPLNGGTDPSQVEPELPGALLVMVENHPDARPQAGLDRADLVYEIEAEGGITRFLAVFYRRHAPRVGPIRSARFYFVQIARAYDSPYAHAGGNNDALKLIRQIGIKDLDEIYNSGAFFWRIRERKMPHNLYSSTQLLLKGAQARGLELQRPPALPAAAVEGGSPAEELTLTYAKLPSYTYVTSYRYEDGSYAKFINGEPHVMEDGEPILAANVVVLFAETKPVKKEDWQLDIQLLGRGEALFFTGGRVYRGSWRKEEAASHFEFAYRDRPMTFAPGNTWINVLPGEEYIEY